MPEAVFKQFTLPNTRQFIKPHVQVVVNFVRDHLPPQLNTREVIFKVEAILIELFTNGIKHAGTPETFLEITIDGAIIIEKKDFGKRFYPGNLTPALLYQTGSKELLSRDSLHSLYAVIESENQMRFVCEEAGEDVEIDIENLMEHFGLLIITKYADTFTYYYDTDSGTNTFIVQIDF